VSRASTNFALPTINAWGPCTTGEATKKLFAQGATKIKTVGVHHYGLACDLVKDIGGEPSWQGDFKQARQEA